MDSGGLQERRIGSVDSYGERITDGKRLQKKYSEKQYPKRGELHRLRRDTSQFNESRKLAESATAQAETELFSAKKTVKGLTSVIEESNLRAKTQLGKVEKLKMSEKSEGYQNYENSQHTKVLRKLRSVKRELSKLKLDMAGILDEKRRAEKETESHVSKMTSYASSVESLTKEIDEINEENVLVELARIEALKEYEEIEAQKKAAAEKHSNAMKETRNKTNEMIQEIEYSEELEAKLAITMSDIKMLENIKEMDKRSEIASESRLALVSIEDEFEATKKELALVNEESFQFMSSMDVVRDELKHVAEESARLRRKEEKAARTAQSLNSKLLRAKAKLEAVSTAEDKAKSTASGLSHTLDKLKTETKSAKHELSLISEETAITKAEIQKTESEVDLAEERLQIVLQELKTAKSLEITSLQNLESLIEKTMRDRASASRDKSTITISKFEYDYLTGHASGAEEIADKKVAAAEAWVEALKESEREILIKVELVRRETQELTVKGDRELNETEKSLHAKKIVKEELHNRRQKYEAENLQPDIRLPRKSMNRSEKRTPARRGKHRISASPMVRNVPRSTSFTVGGRRKVMTNSDKFFSGRNNEANVKHI